MGPLYSAILTVAFCLVGWKNQATAEPYGMNDFDKLGLSSRTDISYYIHENINESWFVDEIRAALNMITDQKCIEFYPHYDLWQADIILYADYGTFAKLDPPTDLCSLSGIPYTPQTLYFQYPFRDRYYVLRGLLSCLAPFKFEHERWDRDGHIVVNWANVIPGKEHHFLAHRTYPPDIPGFGGYTHGNVFRQDFNAYSRNGRKTLFPKFHGDLEKYDKPAYKVDLKRLRLFYSQIKIFEVYRPWLTPWRVENNSKPFKEACQ